MQNTQCPTTHRDYPVTYLYHTCTLSVSELSTTLNSDLRVVPAGMTPMPLVRSFFSSSVFAFKAWARAGTDLDWYRAMRIGWLQNQSQLISGSQENKGLMTRTYEMWWQCHLQCNILFRLFLKGTAPFHSLIRDCTQLIKTFGSKCPAVDLSTSCVLLRIS